MLQRFDPLLLGSGGVLSSRAVSSQVLSALMGLTSVFGMGTGGTPSPLPPEIVSNVGLRCYALQTDYLPKVSFVLLFGMCRPRPATPLSLLYGRAYAAGSFPLLRLFIFAAAVLPHQYIAACCAFCRFLPFTCVRLRILTTA